MIKLDWRLKSYEEGAHTAIIARVLNSNYSTYVSYLTTVGSRRVRVEYVQ